MDVREKFVELIEQSGACFTCFPCGDYDKEEKYKIADYLIANGVTVQEWIPVTERLPKSGDYVLVCDTREDWYGLWEFSGVAWYDASYQPWGIDEVTHWMPLPEPPKGE